MACKVSDDGRQTNSDRYATKYEGYITMGLQRSQRKDGPTH